MKINFRITILIVTLTVVLLFASCTGKNNFPSGDSFTGIHDETESIENTLESVFAGADDFPEEAKSVDYNADIGVTEILLSDNGITVNGTGAGTDGTALTIYEQGTYLLSGSISNGRIIIDTQDTEKVKLILNGVHVSSSASAVSVLNAPKKVIFHTVEGSVNILSDGKDYIVPDEEQLDGEIYPNACIYSTADLKFSGNGELYITSNSGKGINSKDDIEISEGRIFINSADDGIRGSDSVAISSAYITIMSGADGIKSSNAEKEGKGYIDISDGTVNINAANDALQAETTLTITGGIFNFICANGCNTTDASGTDTQMPTGTRRPGGMGGMMPGGMGGMQEGNTQKPTYSCKGIKSSGEIFISGGNFTISTPDDAVHSDTGITVTGGSFGIAAGDDGFHADDIITIDNGDISVFTSYEAIEAVIITINGGRLSLTARDDGINACGGTSVPVGGPRGAGNSSSDTGEGVTPTLTFNGGDVIIYASGDGIDSNGNIIMTGGSVFVYGPTDDRNGAIDYGDGSYSMTISGGTLLAVGSSGMAETARGAGQGVIGVRMSTISAGSTVRITDSSGNTMLEFITPKVISSLVFSSPDITSGNNYTISVNSAELGTVSAI